MAAPFAAIEAATISNVIAALANATATIGGVAVEGIFDANYAEAYDVISGTAPSFLCATTDITSIARGDTIIINSTSYTMQKPPQHDGTGMTRLILQEGSSAFSIGFSSGMG